MMQTGCPACATTFRVTAEQLKARQGQVRCGKCQHIFNALESLVDAPSIAAALALIAPAQAPPSSATPDIAAPAAATEANFATATHPPATETTTESTPAAEPEATPPTSSTPTHADALIQPLRDDLYAAPFATHTTRPARVWPWLCLALLALLLLAGQILLQFRTAASVLMPEAKPALQATCELLGCDLPLPRKADLLSIETSDLHPEPLHKNMLILAATLKNRAPFVVAYPHLELTLTDTIDQPLLRKIIAPADYLPKDQREHTGFTAGNELAIHLALPPESSNKGSPAGYRLYLFYP